MASPPSGSEKIKAEVLRKTGQYDPECVLYVELQKSNISDISFLQLFPSITYLDLFVHHIFCSIKSFFPSSFNQISQLEALSAVPNLLILVVDQNSLINLSFSFPTAVFFSILPFLDGIENCLQLQRLSVCGNPIRSLGDISRVSKLKKLTHLSFYDPATNVRSNICDAPGYREMVISVVPSLLSLDGQRIQFDRLPAAADLIAYLDAKPEKLPVPQPWLKPGGLHPLLTSHASSSHLSVVGFVFRSDMLQPPASFLTDSLQRAREAIEKAKLEQPGPGQMKK
jgi:hypothetical protein